MDQIQLRGLLDESFDQALMYHAFTPYMRDYELIVQFPQGAAVTPIHVRYLFRYCVEASARSAIATETWRCSLDDRFTNLQMYESADDLAGFVWGVKWQNLYPGMRTIEPSAIASSWSEAIGIEFHEVEISTNAQVLTLVFSELTTATIEPGYVPFAVRAMEGRGCPNELPGD